VHWLPGSRHLLLAGAMVTFAIVSGAVWSGTEAVSPYLDSLAMVGSIVATFMVARKIIENWIYWLVTDSVYIYLYLSNDLLWYAGLSVFYMIMASIGLRAWIVDWRRHRDVALVA
jgi:nicotinamide mononucleotide transporter